MGSNAYYNEIDPYAAQWLRNLVSAGHIAPGDVDERSIEDVSPDDLRGYAQCHFFAGIGVWVYALRRAGWPDERPIWTGSCPCQPFSAAGKGGGFADERHLWPAWFHLIGERRPAVVLGEQVASKDGLGWLDLVQADLEAAGYAVGAVDTCSAGSGAPHIRQRLRFVAERVADRPFGGRREERADIGRRPIGDRAERIAAGFGASRATGQLRGVGQADAYDAGLEGRQRAEERAAELAARPGSVAGGVGNSERLRAGRDAGASLGSQGGTPMRPVGDDAGSSSAVCGMADADGRQRDGLAELRRPVSDGPDAGWQEGSRELGARRYDGRPGPVNGFWRAADWIFCRDGKWRPVEPGTFPLAHGAPARVGRLRAYGNAVDAEATRVFIEAWLDTRTVS